jgi:hypothetical protein
MHLYMSVTGVLAPLVVGVEERRVEQSGKKKRRREARCHAQSVLIVVRLGNVQEAIC